MLSKSSIAFLLNPIGAEPSGHDHRKCLPAVSRTENPVSPTKRAKPTRVLSPLSASGKVSAPNTLPSRRLVLGSPSPTSESSSGSDHSEKKSSKDPVKKPRRKRIRVRVSSPCKVDGCENLAVTKGCCVRHGGGARCEFAGCEKRAKKNRRCFTHGGCALCEHEGCSSKAKRYGYCWAHGGGKPCSVAGCDKIGGQGGLCWAHGGGSRCRVAKCTRRSYQKDDYLCAHHARLSGAIVNVSV